MSFLSSAPFHFFRSRIPNSILTIQSVCFLVVVVVVAIVAVNVVLVNVVVVVIVV